MEAITAQLLAPERLQALTMAHQGWLRTLAVLLAAAESPDKALQQQQEQQQRELPPDWHAQRHEALQEALRCCPCIPSINAANIPCCCA